MKAKINHTIIALFAAAAGLPAFAQEADLAAVGDLPTTRRVADLSEDGFINPFVTKILKKETVVEDRDAQESKIRSILSQMKISGNSRGSNGLRVLFGDMVLEQGDVLDPVIENQTQKIMVSKLTSSEVELTWINEVGSRRAAEEAPRRILRTYRLEPSVGRRLKGMGTKGAQNIVYPSPKREQPEAGNPTTASIGY